MLEDGFDAEHVESKPRCQPAARFDLVNDAAAHHLVAAADSEHDGAVFVDAAVSAQPPAMPSLDRIHAKILATVDLEPPSRIRSGRPSSRAERTKRNADVRFGRTTDRESVKFDSRGNAMTATSIWCASVAGSRQFPASATESSAGDLHDVIDHGYERPAWARRSAVRCSLPVRRRAAPGRRGTC